VHLFCPPYHEHRVDALRVLAEWAGEEHPDTTACHLAGYKQTAEICREAGPARAASGVTKTDAVDRRIAGSVPLGFLPQRS
jgi:hypothetical protein